jgi:LuxR family transcriptional regulator, maltose regulon positive regulatory protein
MTAFVAGAIAAKGGLRPTAVKMARPLLLERLLASEVPLVVVCAPAGYGKTALLNEWEANDARPFAWVRASGDDNDPDVLAEHAARALLVAGVLGERRAKPSVTLAGRAAGTAQTDLAATLATADPVVMVFDDAQELVNPRALSLLARLLRQLPNGSNLVLAGRAKPVIGLARLRAESLVLEIGADDLALGPEEAAQLVRVAGPRLSPQAAAVLIERAEGWPVGLALAARSLRSRPDPESDALRFDGDDQDVAEYLEEVVDGTRQELVDFLVETSILERFCAPLCDAVRQRDDSSRVIKALEKANMFIVPLDRTGDWYRYHHLFSAYLQAERRRRLGDNDAALHARASHWWEQRGQLDGAVRHAYASGDFDRFEALVWFATPVYLNNDHIGDLEAWLGLPTPGQVTARPSLALATAWLALALNAGETGPLTAHLADKPDVVLADGMALGTALALFKGATSERRLTDAWANASRAYDAIGTQDPWKAFACLFIGTALRLLGRARQAKATLQEGHDRSAITMPALAASCLVQLAWSAIDEGDPVQAQSNACRARAAFELTGAVHPVTRFAIDATSAFLLARSGDAAGGHRYAQLALKEVPAAEGAPGVTSIEARVLLARALVLLSDHAAARRLLGEIRSLALRIREPGSLTGKIVEAQAAVDAAFAACPVPDPLTPAEMRVLSYLPTYMTFEEIGRDLIVSRTTVKTQAIAVYRKLGVKSRAEAVRKARQQGLLLA